MIRLMTYLWFNYWSGKCSDLKQLRCSTSTTWDLEITRMLHFQERELAGSKMVAIAKVDQ